MGLVQKVGNFLGVKKFADSLASTGRVLSGSIKKDIKNQEAADNATQRLTYIFKNEKDPAKKAQLKQLIQSQLNTNTSASQIDPGLNLTGREIYGSATNVVLNSAMPGAFKGGKAAVLAKNAALGAGFGAASGLEKGRSNLGIIGSTVGGAATGAAIGGVGLMAKGVKNFFTKTTPEWMINKAVRPALQDLKKNVKFGTDTLGKELLDEGVKGGPRKLLEIADNKSSELEMQLVEVLTHPELESARITRKQIAPYLREVIAQKKKVPGSESEIKKINQIYKSLPESMTLSEANEWKRAIYTELKDVSYKMDSKLAPKAATIKQIARGLKTEIEKTVGGNVVTDINKKLSIYGRLENSMVDELARSMRNNGISLTDAVLTTGGGTLTALAILRHFVKGTGTYGAQALKKTGQVLESKAVQGVKNQVIRRGGFNLP